MTHIIHDLVQGTPQWDAHRRTHYNASEAAAMLGLSLHVTRSELICMKATGAEKEYSDFVQKHVLDKGHEYEALTRPIAEATVGEDLYPVTASKIVDGMPLSASYDGLTMTEELAWENKRLNKALNASLERGILPDDKWPQLEQQLLVVGAGKVLFTASDGDAATMREIWYESVPARRKRLLAGWKQFALDVAAYVPEPTSAPTPTGKAPESLPALRIEVTGRVTASNLAEFKETALSAIASVNRDLQTDEDFANASAAVKWCGEIESRIEAAKNHALSQTETIDILFRALDDIHAEARRTRLDIAALIKNRNDAIRVEIRNEFGALWATHYASLNKRIGKPYMPVLAPDFTAVMKGKRTVTSLRGACADELAKFKIAANESADLIDINMTSLRELAKDHAFLFSDTGSLVTKDNDALVAIVKLRISEHEADEKVKADAIKAAADKKAADDNAVAEKAIADKKIADDKAAADKIEADRVAADLAAREPAPAQECTPDPGITIVQAAAQMAADITGTPGALYGTVAPIAARGRLCAISPAYARVVVLDRIGKSISELTIAELHRVEQYVVHREWEAADAA